MKNKVYRKVAITLSLIGLGAILVSIFTDHNQHNYVLAIGLGLTAIANIINYISYIQKYK